jgi:hypothetical protein
MSKRLKQLFEKIAYAGLKPQAGRPAKSGKPKGGSALQAWIDGKLNQAGPADPLYISNRTLGQKLKTWAAFGVPAAAVLAALAFVLFRARTGDAPPAPPPQTPSNAEIAAKLLPDLNSDLHIAKQSDLDIEDVHVVSGRPARLAGIAKNNSDHPIATAELVFDLTDKTGSRQGAVSTEVKNIAAKASVPFTFPIEQTAATFALVREVHVQ